MKKIQFNKVGLITFLFMLALNLSSFSQKKQKFTIPEMQRPEKCATMQLLEQQLKTDPEIYKRMEEIEQYNKFFLSSNQLNTRSVITIPVVVHIVYRNNFENIPDSRVFDQIRVLNEDFRGTNLDANNTPSAFLPRADCEINFCLAQRNPAGMYTTGIERYSSTRTSSWGIADAVKKPSDGGIAPWDATKYLNIWVCDIGGYLGYAQFPGGSLSTDGIVVDYNSFGTTGTLHPYDLGRTATHEVGHWLNLKHIWGDANCGDDEVDDTPTQQRENYGCPSFPHMTCGNGSRGDMFMNYMDYTDDRCMYMFSPGQKSRMRATLNGVRSSLKNSDGCQPGYESAGLINLNCYQCIGGSDFEGNFNFYPNANNITWSGEISGLGYPWFSTCGTGGNIGVYGFHGSEFTIDVKFQCFNREYSSTLSYTPNCIPYYGLKNNNIVNNKNENGLISNNTVNNKNSQRSFSTSPNPVSDNLFIFYDVKTNVKYNVSIIDQFGKNQINIENSNVGQHEINVKNLTNGLYFVVLKTNEGDLQTKKIMVSH